LLESEEKLVSAKEQQPSNQVDNQEEDSEQRNEFADEDLN